MRERRALLTSVRRAILRIAFLAPGLLAIGVLAFATGGRRLGRASRPQKWRRGYTGRPGAGQCGGGPYGPSTLKPLARSMAGRPPGPTRWPTPTTPTVTPEPRIRPAITSAQRALRARISRANLSGEAPFRG